ncbi:MAG: GNAT family N-acetyltransferase [Oscillospiraceae bacterium]|nr:GNAT family N-acetyltransferase [Oscillospiraceae bacterium]
MRRTATVERFRRAGETPDGEICYAVAKYTIREIAPDEYALLNDFLYNAIFVPEGVPAPPREIINRPELQVYTEKFGEKQGDAGFVAEVGGSIVGAVWVRIMQDYGHIDNDTPSLAISLFPAFRGQKIGTALMQTMLVHLAQTGYRQVSLSVQKQNKAVNLYRKLGFQTAAETGEEYIMVYRFTDSEQ